MIDKLKKIIELKKIINECSCHICKNLTTENTVHEEYSCEEGCFRNEYDAPNICNCPCLTLDTKWMGDYLPESISDDDITFIEKYAEYFKVKKIVMDLAELKKEFGEKFHFWIRKDDVAIYKCYIDLSNGINFPKQNESDINIKDVVNTLSTLSKITFYLTFFDACRNINKIIFFKDLEEEDI